MSRGLTGMTQNKGAVLTIETFIIPEAKESTAGPQQRQDFVDRFSRLPWGGASRIRTTRPNSHQTTARGYFVAFVMLCSANDRTGGQQNLGSSITTMHPPILRIWFKVFWLNTTFPWFVRLPTLPTWLLVIFGCSPNWKCRWKGPDLSQEKTLCGTRRPSCTRFHKKLSRNVSSNGRTTGRSVCITKETTLKGITVSGIKINNCIFADKQSDTFCTAHVCAFLGW